MAIPVIFHAEQLWLFDLTPATFDPSSLRKQYLSFALRHHPDKNAGERTYVFEQGEAVYRALLAGFETFAVWQCNNSNLTLAETIEWTEPPTGSISSSAAQHAADAWDLAPTWHPDLMREVGVVDVLEKALQMIAAEFHVSVSVMAASLRQAAVGTSCTFLLHGAEQPAEPRYHGTSWKGLIGISTRGFLPCWGAGRAKALEKFNVDLPVVYTSPDWDLALWYPMAMVDIRGDRIGERVASDAPPMRIVLICKADATKRRIKIRRGKNKQDAWLPKDLEICGVAFHMMSAAAAANESAAQDEDGAESDVDANPPRAGVWAENEDSEDQEDFEAEPENEDPKDQEMVF